MVFYLEQVYCTTFAIQFLQVTNKAFLALCLTFIIPLASYFIVKQVSEDAVAMPPRYYADSVSEKVVNGKFQSDTLWHQVENITLTNQLGDLVSLDSIHNKVYVIDFFFTHCPSICPGMTKNMKRLQDMMISTDPRKVIDTPLVHFISISIDPERDTVAAIKKYADKAGVNHERWWMLTGNKDSIYNFGINELKLGIIDGNGKDTLFNHSPKFILLDKNRVVRGYYNGLDDASILKLSQDIVFLSLEKNKKLPSPVFAKLKQLWPVFVTVIIAIIVLWIFVFKPTKNNN